MPRRTTLFALVFVFLAALSTPHLLAGQEFTRGKRAQVTFIPDNPSDIYAIGAKVGWTVTLNSDTSVPPGNFTYTIKKNNFEVIKSGELDLRSGPKRVEVKVDDPAMVYLIVQQPAEANGNQDGRPLFLAFTAGAAVAPTKLQPSLPKPADFDAFWKSKVNALMKVPANPVLTPGDSQMANVDYSTIRMDHVNGGHVYGQLAVPTGKSKHPAVLVLQWASPPYPLQKPWVTDLASKGWIALNIEPHDVLPTEPQEYYDALPQAIKNYNSIGWDDRDKSYFVQMYLADYRAVEYLASRPDWDGKTLLVMGTSMGGQQSLCVVGLNHRITHLIVEEPAGCDTNGPLHGRQAGYPNFPSNNPRVMEASRYVDAVNFASNIRATSLVAMGFVDTVAPPVGIWTAFNQIRGAKEAAPMIEAPHNNIATRAQQQLYFRRSADWLDTLAKGGRVTVNALDK